MFGYFSFNYTCIVYNDEFDIGLVVLTCSFLFSLVALVHVLLSLCFIPDPIFLIFYMASSSKQNIEQSYANLSINDDGEDGLILEDVNEGTRTTDWALCLVGSFITNMKVNFMAMQDTLAGIWRPVKGVCMEESNVPNLFLFKFFHDLDMQRV